MSRYNPWSETGEVAEFAKYLADKPDTSIEFGQINYLAGQLNWFSHELSRLSFNNPLLVPVERHISAYANVASIERRKREVAHAATRTQ